MDELFFPWMFMLKPYLTYLVGGLPAVIWTYCMPLIAGW